MRCSKIEGLLPAYTEGDLSEKKGKVVEKHLASCSQCSESAEFYQLLGPLTKSLYEKKSTERRVDSVELREVAQEDWARVWQGICTEITSQPGAKPSPIRKLFLPLFQRHWLTPALAGALAILLLVLLNPLKSKDTLEPEGVEIVRQEVSPEKETRAAKEGTRGFIDKDMEEKVKLSARQLWEFELEEIKSYDDRESPLLALRDTLEYLGEKVDYDYLQFASGASFHLFLHRSSLSQEQEYSLAVLENASAAYGYSSQWVINQDLPTTLKTIEESLQENRPLLTVGIEGIKGYLMIIAYNQEEGSLQVKRYGKDQSSEYTWIPLPQKEWQAPFYEEQGMVNMPLFILGEKGEVPSRKEVARKVLRQALRFARGRENPDTGHYSGLAAYDKWIAILQEERKLEQELIWPQEIMRVSLNPLGDTLRRSQLARKDLILIAEELDQEEAKEYILAAATNYTKISTTAKELQNLLSTEAIEADGRGSCEVEKIASENEAIAAEAVALLQDILAWEKAAITDLEKIIQLA